MFRGIKPYNQPNQYCIYIIYINIALYRSSYTGAMNIFTNRSYICTWDYIHIYDWSYTCIWDCVTTMILLSSSFYLMSIGSPRFFCRYIINRAYTQLVHYIERLDDGQLLLDSHVGNYRYSIKYIGDTLVKYII